MSGYDTTSDVESGVMVRIPPVHDLVCHLVEERRQVRRGMRRQGASQRSLEEYMSGYDTQVAHNIQPKECK